MKKIALSLAALALTAGSALAADLPSRKGPPVLTPPSPPPVSASGNRGGHPIVRWYRDPSGVAR
jgi:hypothetical protein